MMRLMFISSNVYYSLKPFISICLYSITDVDVNHCINEHMEHLEALFPRKTKSKSGYEMNTIEHLLVGCVNM